MARYRDELEAAQARVAALEEQVRALGLPAMVRSTQAPSATASP